MQKILILVLSYFLTACTTITPAVAICEGFFYIYPSKSDTLETKRQILTHNQTFKKLCIEEVKNSQKDD